MVHCLSGDSMSHNNSKGDSKSSTSSSQSERQRAPEVEASAAAAVKVKNAALYEQQVATGTLCAQVIDDFSGGCSTLRRAIGASEDRILLRETDSGQRNYRLSSGGQCSRRTSPVLQLANNWSAAAAGATGKGPASPDAELMQSASKQVDFNNEDAHSITTTTSDVNSDDDAASLASRLSQIVVEQESKLFETDRKASSAAGSFSGTFKSAAKVGGSSRRKQQSGRQQVGPAAAGSKRPDSAGSSCSNERQPEINIIINGSESMGKPEVDDRPQGADRVRAKSAVEPNIQATQATQPLFMRRNESSGHLPERGDLRSLEINRRMQAAAAAAAAASTSGAGPTAGSSNEQSPLNTVRFRSNTAGSTDRPTLLDSNGQLMLNIQRSAWTLNEFDQTFNKSETSSLNEGSDQATGGSSSDPLRSDPEIGGGHLALGSYNTNPAGCPQTSPSAAAMMTGSLAAAASAASASVKVAAAKLTAYQQQQQSQQEANNNNPLIRSSKKLAISSSNLSSQLYQQQPGSGRRYSATNNMIVGSNNNLLLSMPRDRRHSEVSSSSLDSYSSNLDLRKRALTKSGLKSSSGGGGGDSSLTGNRRGGRAAEGDATRGGNCFTSCCNLDTLGQYLPIIQWLPSYSKGLFWNDLMAGMAVAVLNISTSLSAAVVAETDLGVAFRASIVNTFVYALLCSSKHTSFGSWSIMSQMLLVSVRRALSDELILQRLQIGPSGQGSAWDAAEYERWHLNIIIMYTFLIGLTQLMGGLLKLGNILASFIPEALCSSMIAATAFTMAVGQLANMCGTSNKILASIERNTTALWADLRGQPTDITDLFAGLFRWIRQIALLIKYHEQINVICVLISAASVIILFLNQCLVRKLLLKHLKRNLFLPAEMILLIGMILLSYWLNLSETYQVPTCGPINVDFDIPQLPNLKLIRELWFESLATALISYTMVYIMAKTYSNKFNYEVDCNQELIACGAGNLIGGLFDALPATASFSRTAGQVEAGGKTQMASIVNCLLLVASAKLLGHHVSVLPVCVMAACLFYSFVRMMTRFMEIFDYWRVCKVDFSIWLVTFVAIITLDLVTGFVYGFIFSILTMLYRAQNRRCYMLGCIGSSDVYVPLVKYPLAREIDGIKIFQFCGPIHYVCADLFERLLRQKTRVNVKQIARDIADQQLDKFNPRDLNLPAHIILDFSMISFIDSAGIHVIKKIIEDYQSVNVTVLLASLASHVAAVVKSEPSLWETYKDHFYITLADAVHCAMMDTRGLRLADKSGSNPNQSPTQGNRPKENNSNSNDQ